MTTPWRNPVVKVMSSEDKIANNTNTASATVNVIQREIPAKYPDDVVVVKPEIPEEKAKDVYKLILEAHMNNPIRGTNQVVIMSMSNLAKLVQELTDCKEVQITSVVDVECCGKPTKYNTIGQIVCITENDVRVDFEIEYNKEWRLLKDYRISTNIAYDDE